MTKIYLPWDEAVTKAAEQNINHDIRIGVFEGEDPTEEDRETYKEEAEYLLKISGENYLPEEPDTEHICWKDYKGEKVEDDDACK